MQYYARSILIDFMVKFLNMDILDLEKRFPTHEVCIKHLEEIRWGDEPKCPYCGSIKVTYIKKENRYHCNACNKSFTVMVGTIFQKTKDLNKWFHAINLQKNLGKELSGRRLAESIDVDKNTACRMQKKIKEALAKKDKLVSRIV